MRCDRRSQPAERTVPCRIASHDHVAGVLAALRRLRETVDPDAPGEADGREQNAMTRAVVMRSYGGPETLRIEDRPTVRLAPGEVRVRVLAATVNHSDLEVRSGAWPVRRQPAFPYVPGLEAVGDVTEVAAGTQHVREGQRVWTMMQGLGGVRAERDGGYAEEVVVEADALAPLPDDLDPVAAAAVGLAGVTAACGLCRLLPGSAAGDARPLPPLVDLAGRALAVTGAGGGVGSLAVALAAAAGARVLGVAGREQQAAYVRGLGATEVVVGRGASVGLTAGSLDGVLDTVAGPLFGTLVAALRRSGRYCLVGAVAGSQVSFDAWSLEARVLTAWSSEDLDGSTLRAATEDLVSVLRPGRLAAPAVTVLPLEDAARAHALLEAHEVTGRLVLVP